MYTMITMSCYVPLMLLNIKKKKILYVYLIESFENR